jgi:CubicO group peptidase (beta-lactamase class C family)
VTGVSLAQYLEKEFFQPLGMKHTALGASAADCDCCLVFEGETINMDKAEVCDGDRGYVSTAGDLMQCFYRFS